VQDIAQELSQQYAAAAGNSSSSGPDPQQQQSLVFELNRSGRYLAMKGQLKQMLVDVVRERYKAAGSTATPAQVRAADATRTACCTASNMMVYSSAWRMQLFLAQHVEQILRSM
jgi:hypothetical protein